MRTNKVERLIDSVYSINSSFLAVVLLQNVSKEFLGPKLNGIFFEGDVV